MKKNGFNSRFCAKYVVVGQVGPALQPCGAGSDNASVKGHLAAFTLIELLVVVLIIGILAAVALPQYKLAVVKSRVSTMLPLIKSMTQAEEAYYLSNSTYTINAQLLDVSMPAECSFIDDERGNDWKCGNDFLIDFSDLLDGVYLNYCPGKNTDFNTCKAARDFTVIWLFQHSSNPSAGHRVCIEQNGSSLGKKVCNSLVLN